MADTGNCEDGTAGKVRVSHTGTGATRSMEQSALDLEVAALTTLEDTNYVNPISTKS